MAQAQTLIADEVLPGAVQHGSPEWQLAVAIKNQTTIMSYMSRVEGIFTEGKRYYTETRLADGLNRHQNQVVDGISKRIQNLNAWCTELQVNVRTPMSAALEVTADQRHDRIAALNEAFPQIKDSLVLILNDTISIYPEMRPDAEPIYTEMRVAMPPSAVRTVKDPNPIPEVV